MNELGVLLEESTSSSLPMRPSQMGGGGGGESQILVLLRVLGSGPLSPSNFLGVHLPPRGSEYCSICDARVIFQSDYQAFYWLTYLLPPPPLPFCAQRVLFC